MKIYTLIVCTIFILWLIATLIVQFRETKFTQKLKSYDTLSLLPLWTFFAPNPGVNDYHLLYRDEDEFGNRSDWKEIEINENRKISTCLWNPTKRGKKVINDVIQNIIPVTHQYKDKPQVIMVALPYILLLNAVMKQPKIYSNSYKKQFLVSATDGYEHSGNPTIVVLSEFHPI